MMDDGNSFPSSPLTSLMSAERCVNFIVPKTPCPFCNLREEQSGHGFSGGGAERMCINRWLVFWSDGMANLDSALPSPEQRSALLSVLGAREWNNVRRERSVSRFGGEKCSETDEASLFSKFL